MTFSLVVFGSDQKANLMLMHEIGLVSRLLHILKDPSLPQATIDTIASVLTVMLQGNLDGHSLLRYVVQNFDSKMQCHI